MNLADRLQRVAVLGAGGKMGSGISLLLARAMTLQKLAANSQDHSYELVLMDVNSDALDGLQAYLRKQAMRYAEKKNDSLSEYYPGKSAEEIQAAFADDMAAILTPVTTLDAVGNARLVFEAILEKIDLKTRVYNQLKDLCGPETIFMTNTSSIPIHSLESATGLEGRILGYHFYNPPAVQKLVELIIPESVSPELVDMSKDLGQRLGKIIIPSNDIAGFIGNGHFMRDGLYGISEALRLQSEGVSFAQAVYMMNRVTRDFLLRPMGIFQLIDYVGLDIFQSILKIMDPHFSSETLHSELIDILVENGVKGGQFSDGSQKDGFLKYEGGKPAAIYDTTSKSYLPLAEDSWETEADQKLGDLPASHAPWKAMMKNPEKNTALSRYFADLAATDTLGAGLAINYLKASKDIGQLLVDSGVSENADNVNGVLMNGFFHLYGPINEYV